MFWLSEYITNGWVWWIVNLLYGLTILGVVAVVVSENRNPVKSLAWVTVLLVVPLVGLVLYLVFGRNIQNKRIISRRNRRKLRRLTARHLTDLRHGRPPESLQARINLASALCGSNYYEGNHAEVFDNGIDKFNALLADIAAAQHYINLQYYIIVDDNIGTRVLSALEERARAGVKVRIIYDHVGSFKLSRKALRRLKVAGVEAYPFFKVVFPPFGTRINWRNHRKIAIIDGTVGYIGGMNVADRYIDGGKMFPMWRDLHLRVTGPAVAAVVCGRLEFHGTSAPCRRGSSGAPAPQQHRDAACHRWTDHTVDEHDADFSAGHLRSKKMRVYPHALFHPYRGPGSDTAGGGAVKS